MDGQGTDFAGNLTWALYLSRHFILVDIFCANQLEAKFMSVPLKSLHICLSGKSINKL